MKKFLSLILALTFIFALTGCKNDKDRILYNVDLEKYVELGEYKGIKVNTESTEFEKYRAEMISADVSAFDLYVKKTDGVLKNGDVANIDYVGKKNGVAFEGGTAEGYDLELGSDSFIDGFEDGLIGKKIGDTVDLNLTFPENYGNEELNGAAVVFTVKINYVKTDEEMDPADFYKELEYDTLEAYYEYVEKSAVKNYIFSKIVEATKIKEHPKKDQTNILKQRMAYLEKYIKNYYGITLEEYCNQTGETVDSIEETTNTNYVEPMMDEQMICYAILDKEGLVVTKEDIDKRTKALIANISDGSLTEADIKEYYGDYYFEYMTISEKVMDFLYENAKIS